MPETQTNNNATPLSVLFRRMINGAAPQAEAEIDRRFHVGAASKRKLTRAEPLMRFDPGDGTEDPYPSEAVQWREWHGRSAWLFCPWTGNRRDGRDIGSDPFGHLLVPPGEPIRASGEYPSAAFVAERERDSAIRRAESDLRPTITAEDAARCAWNVCGDEPEDGDAAERIDAALRAHAVRAKVPRG